MFRYFLLTFICCVLFFAACFGKKQSNASNSKGFAVVELYTSEGCSSCPAADAVLAKIGDEYKSNVYAMEFHVDYWNYIGWKDEYGNADYSQRQHHYAGLLHLNAVYTPQAIVNGKYELVGSDETKLRDRISGELQKSNATDIKVTAKVSGAAINVHYEAGGKCKGQLLNVALVQKQAEVNVKRGENSGRKLHHSNIVRSLRAISISSATGDATVDIPQGVAAKDCIIIAYIQDSATWGVNAATQCAIN